MTNALRSLVVLSDTHLRHDSRLELIDALARLVEAHPGAEIVLAGDVFDLSLEVRGTEPALWLSGLLERHGRLGSTLREHVRTGGKVTLIPGNHDAIVVDDRMREALLGRLELTADAPLEVSPWFIRRGDVHVEHGHLYDPDNAPVHPLALWSPLTEPIGVALMRRFVGPVGATAFAHNDNTTPARALARAFRVYGLRAPAMIARYFYTAAGLCLQAGGAAGQAAAIERAEGQERLADFAATLGLEPDGLGALLDVVPRPTQLSRRDTFMRLYFDRVVTTLLLLGGGLAGLAGKRLALGVASVSAGYLLGSLTSGGSRYDGRPRERLRDAADSLRELTGARLVLMGHTHYEDERPGYFNTGSFAYPEQGLSGRPYVVVGEDGRGERRRWSGTSAAESVSG